MTTATANREGRRLARQLATASPEHRDAVLRVTHPMIADACRRHLAYLNRKVER